MRAPKVKVKVQGHEILVKGLKNYLEYRVHAQNKFQDRKKMHKYVVNSISKMRQESI
jgi:hypothetical protein